MRLPSLTDTGGRTSKLLEATWGCSWKSRNGGCGMLFSGSLGTVLVFLIYASWTAKQHQPHIFGTNIQIAYQWSIHEIVTFQKSLHRSVHIRQSQLSGVPSRSPEELCRAIFSLVLLATVNVPAEAIVTLVPSSISGHFVHLLCRNRSISGFVSSFSHQ